MFSEENDVSPVLVEVTRGGRLESKHRGVFAVVGEGGRLIASGGALEKPIFPRSAIKVFQCFPMLVRSGQEKFGLTDAEIALMCASHNGEDLHMETAQKILQKINASEEDYACGTHWSLDQDVMREMVKRGELPRPLRHNCSGKHAGMLALARLLGAPLKGYFEENHPVQQTILQTLCEVFEISKTQIFCGIDGCSVPTWAISPKALAYGFQKFAALDFPEGAQRHAAEALQRAVRKNPFMVAGTGRFCTRLMEKIPRAFVKMGAEGVFCASVPHARLGFALKCDDGALRASEVAIAALLLAFDIWSEQERALLKTFSELPLYNAQNKKVGEIKFVGGPLLEGV